MNYRYRIYPDVAQQQRLIEWMEICRSAYNYGLREIKDWCDSRKCLIDRCSTEKEHIIPADAKFPGEVQQLNNLPKAKKEFPRLSEVPSQVLQQAIKQLHRSWEYFQTRGFGFPRFKKFGQFKSLLFPQFKENPVTLTGISSGEAAPTPVALCRGTPTGCASCFMPGNPYGLRHLLYAGGPVHRNGLPSTAMAYRPPQWLTAQRTGSQLCILNCPK